MPNPGSAPLTKKRAPISFARLLRYGRRAVRVVPRLEVVRLAHQAGDHRGDDAGGGRQHEGGGRVAGAQEQGVEADQAGQDQDKLSSLPPCRDARKRPGTAQSRFSGAPARGHAGAAASVVPKEVF